MTMTLPHPNAPAATSVAAPARYAVLDGRAYWVAGGTLMTALVGSWEAAAPAATSGEVADMIADRLSTTFTLIDLAERKD